MTEHGPPQQGISERRERRLASIGLAGISLCFASFFSQYVFRVTNNLWGDIAFSGTSAAIGHRLALGERMYRDVVLPIPPGSFLVLSYLERISGWGGPSLLLEAVICSVCHLCMGLLGYVIARALVGRLNALFVAASTVAWICTWAKEVAYDHLAQLCAWAGLALLVLAWAARDSRKQQRLLLFGGVAAGLTLLFKQSTATGIFAGGLIGIAYLAGVDRAGALATWSKGAFAYAAGALAGFAGCLAATAVTGGSVGGFLRAVFLDGTALKGGARFLAQKTLFGVLAEPFVVFSLFGIAFVMALATRIAARSGGLVSGSASESIDDAAGSTASLGKRRIAGIVGLSAAAFGFGAGMLVMRANGVPMIVRAIAMFSPLVVQIGCLLTVAFFFGNTRSKPMARSARSFNAAALAAFTLAAIVGMSMSNTLRLLDDNNVTIVIVLAAVFGGLERAGLGALRWLALVFMLSAPLASKLPRAMLAKTAVNDGVFFRSMLVNEDGLDVVRAAARARELAGTDGTVLVLPEDPSLAALIGRSRPRLCGAIVFVDQYPDRCLERDLRYIGEHLPRVVVTHPTRPEDWRPVFRQWRPDAPAELFVSRFRDRHAKAYLHDSTYSTRWADRTTALDVWVLRADEHEVLPR